MSHEFGFGELEKGKRYSEWIYRTIKPYLSDTLLEIGCGVGNLTEFFSQKHSVVATDISDSFLKVARKRFADNSAISFQELNIEKEKDLNAPHRIGSVVLINVLEHISDDTAALRNIYSLLSPGGRVVIFVPALSWLYSSIDKSFGHCRRYDKATLTNRLKKAGFEIEEMRYFNMIGIIYWFIFGKLFKKKNLVPYTGTALNLIVPVVEFIEKIVPPPLGQSLLAVGYKNKKR